MPGFVDSHTHPVFGPLKPDAGTMPLADDPLGLLRSRLPAPPPGGIRNIAPKGLALNIKRWAPRLAGSEQPL